MEEGPAWLDLDLPLEMGFELEVALRRIYELDEDQLDELIRHCLKHNFSLVHILRQAFQRVEELEEIVDEALELATNQEDDPAQQ